MEDYIINIIYVAREFRIERFTREKATFFESLTDIFGEQRLLNITNQTGINL